MGSSGSAYVTGYTYSVDFPTASAYQGACASCSNLSPTPDVFVAKLNPSGTALVYSTFLGGSDGSSGGGSGSDWGVSIAVDSSGNAYITGVTQSDDFPTTPGAFQVSARGGGEAFATKLSSDGSSLVYSTYLGRAGADAGLSIAVDPLDYAYITGRSGSDVFVIKLSPSGSELAYSSHIGGSGIEGYAANFFSSAIAVDSAGNAYLTGVTSSSDFPTTSSAAQPTYGGGAHDAYVAKLDPSGSQLVYSTYLGGSGDDVGLAIAVDSSGSAYVMGATSSTDFPTTPGAFQGLLSGGTDVYVAKLNDRGSVLLYSTYIGGSGHESITPCTLSFPPGGIAVDPFGNAYVAGATTSSDFPTAYPIQETNQGSPLCGNAFAAKLNPEGSSLVFSTYLGGFGKTEAHAISLDSSGGLYLIGETTEGFPTTDGVLRPTFRGDSDAFIAKIVSAAIVSLAVSSLDFGNLVVGTTSAPQAVTLTNTGDLALTTGSITTTGDFAETHDCPLSPATLVPKANCSITATFTPTATGTRSGAITITDDAPGSPHTVSLTGTGVGPAVSLSLISLDFGSQRTGATSAAQTVTLTNSGTAPLTIFSLGISGDFAQTGTCGGAVATGANCTIDVTFTPTATGTRTGTLTITSDAPGSPHTVDLSGTGTGPVMALSPASVAFAGQLLGTTSPSQPVTLSNSGDAALTITGITISGDSAETHTCSSSVSAGASCGINVTFTSTATGTRSGTVTINDDAPGSPHVVQLSGTGTNFSLGAAPGSSTSATVNAGQTANYTLTLAPGGFSGDVSLSCTEKVTAATCTVTPKSVMLDGVNPADIAVSVATTACSLAAPRGLLLPPKAGRYTGLVLQLSWMLALVALSMLGLRPGVHIGAGRTLTSQITRMAAPLAAAMLCVLPWAACGGGGGGAVPPPPRTCTRVGTYTVTVSATADAVRRSIDLSLKVN